VLRVADRGGLLPAGYTVLPDEFSLSGSVLTSVWFAGRSEATKRASEWIDEGRPGGPLSVRRNHLTEGSEHGNGKFRSSMICPDYRFAVDHVTCDGADLAVVSVSSRRGRLPANVMRTRARSGRKKTAGCVRLLGSFPRYSICCRAVICVFPDARGFIFAWPSVVSKRKARANLGLALRGLLLRLLPGVVVGSYSQG